MTRQPTPEELQRCADAACLATGDEPTSEDVNAARDAIANPSYVTPDSWGAAVLVEWSRILAEAAPDARDGEIAELRAEVERLKATCAAKDVMIEILSPVVAAARLYRERFTGAADGIRTGGVMSMLSTTRSVGDAWARLSDEVVKCSAALAATQESDRG